MFFQRLRIHELFIAVVSSLIASAIIGIAGFFIGQVYASERYERQFRSAQLEYAKQLGRLISRTSQDGLADAVVNARAIVALRNEQVATLTALQHLLNSEITEMQRVLERANLLDGGRGNGGASVEDVRRELHALLRVLRAKWEGKERRIRVAVRKLMTELGLERLGARVPELDWRRRQLQ